MTRGQCAWLDSMVILACVIGTFGALCGVFAIIAAGLGSARAQTNNPSGSPGTNGFVHQYPKRIFSQGEVTVNVMTDGPRVEAVLYPNKVDADTAIIELFYRYEAPDMKGSDGKPVKLLLSSQAICPVIGITGSLCDVTAREGLTLESIEFVRVKFLKTVKEVDRIKAQP